MIFFFNHTYGNLYFLKVFYYVKYKQGETMFLLHKIL